MGLTDNGAVRIVINYADEDVVAVDGNRTAKKISRCNGGIVESLIKREQVSGRCSRCGRDCRHHGGDELTPPRRV